MWKNVKIGDRMKHFLFQFIKYVSRDENSLSVQKTVRTVLCALFLFPDFISF